jgi:hypothetical protein
MRRRSRGSSSSSTRSWPATTGSSSRSRSSRDGRSTRAGVARRSRRRLKPSSSKRYERLDDPQVLRDHLRRIGRDLKTDPAGAIASSKELVETILRLILEDYKVETRKGEGLPDLYKKVQKALELNAEAVPESRKGSEATVKTLRSLVTAIQGLAELRNELGLGHGRARRSPALSRHGRLAFNAAVTVSEFLLDVARPMRGRGHVVAL